MEKITSRQNHIVQHLRRLGTDRDYRELKREFVCEGPKLLEEAVRWGAEIVTVLTDTEDVPQTGAQTFLVARELAEYASPVKNGQGVVFSCRIPEPVRELPQGRAIVLERLQDPGNVGTVIRTANAFGIDSVVLIDCADVYNPKTVRATMGGMFRQTIVETDISALPGLIEASGMRLYAAALTGECIDVRELPHDNVAVAVGNEGRGLSAELIGLAVSGVRIPMSEKCESLNAAVAASVIMWELARQD